MQSKDETFSRQQVFDPLFIAICSNLESAGDDVWELWVAFAGCLDCFVGTT
jgi:hypothetical protein